MALPLYSLTLFVSAFILFLVQPIIGKLILPMLGGTPQVWNTCMVFFQTALLGGYSFTHTTSTRVPTLRRQIIVHCVLLLIPVIFLFPPLFYTDPAGQNMISEQQALMKKVSEADKDSLSGLSEGQLSIARQAKEFQSTMPQSAETLKQAEKLMTSAAGFLKSGEKDKAVSEQKAAIDQLNEAMSRYFGPFNFRAFQSSIPLGGNPIPWALGLLALLVGLPFFTVATVSPLLQRWFAHTGHEAAKDPYFLSIASNVGSLLSLLAYPVFIEPYLSLAEQRYTWSVMYILLAFLIVSCAALAWKHTPPEPEREPEKDPAQPAPPAPATSAAEGAAPPAAPASTAVQAAPPPAPPPPPRPAVQTGISRKKLGKKGSKPAPVAAAHAPAAAAARVPDVAIRDDNITPWRRFRWVMLGAAPSSLMLGIITYICTDLSPIPLLWVIPLALYLISFICVFARWPVVWVDQPHKYVLIVQPVLVILLALLIGPRSSFAGHLNFLGLFVISMPVIHIAIAMLAFFATALMCHGEMAKDRPSARHLTEFYLWMSVGGMVGGMFNGLVAPVLFWGVLEFPMAIVVGCLLRPQQRRDGWAESLLQSISPNLITWFRDKGDELARAYKRPEPRSTYALNYTLDVVLPLLLGGVALLLSWLTVNDYFSVTPLIRFFKETLGFDIRKAQSWGINSRNIVVIYLPMLVCLFFLARPIRLGLAIGALLLVQGVFFSEGGVIYADRSYFGVLRVFTEVDDRYGEVHSLRHGSTHHGLNYQWGPQRRLATTYYHQHGPAGLVMRQWNWFDDGFRPVKIDPKTGEKTYDPNQWTPQMLTYSSDARMPAALIGLCASGGPMGPLDGITAGLWAEPPFATIGLGTGTMASYGRFFQHVHYYEIDRKIRLLSLPEEDSQKFKGRAPVAEAFVADGAVTRIEIKKVSTTYQSAPEVTISGGGGAGATAKAVLIDGVLVDYKNKGGDWVYAIKVESGGSGYTSPPTVTVAPPDPEPYFCYLHDARYKRASIVQVRMGDARLRMAMPYTPYNEEDEKKGQSRGGGPDSFYHMMVVDAFSSDAIPIHLITKEAIEMYMKKLVPDGILCVHTSNRHVDLVPVVEAVARSIKTYSPEGLATRKAHDLAPFSTRGGRNILAGHFNSEWVMVARNPKILERLSTPPLYNEIMRSDVEKEIRDNAEANPIGWNADTADQYRQMRYAEVEYWATPAQRRQTRDLQARWNPRRVSEMFVNFPWTDDYSNVFSVFRL